MTATLSHSVGCSPRIDAESESPVFVSGPPPTFAADHDCAGTHEGPHGGHVIELGHDHEYHAEILEDNEHHGVTVYLLGADLREHAIAEPEVRIAFAVSGEPKAIILPAWNSVQGRTSRFVSIGDQAFTPFQEREANGRLLVTIDGRAYSGEIEPHVH